MMALPESESVSLSPHHGDSGGNESFPLKQKHHTGNNISNPQYLWLCCLSSLLWALKEPSLPGAMVHQLPNYLPLSWPHHLQATGRLILWSLIRKCQYCCPCVLIIECTQPAYWLSRVLWKSTLLKLKLLSWWQPLVQYTEMDHHMVNFFELFCGEGSFNLEDQKCIITSLTLTIFLWRSEPTWGKRKTKYPSKNDKLINSNYNNRPH